MKRIIMFLLLFAALKVAGQTTGYLRFDTVRIMKQNGTCELYIINKTKDSLGLLTNVGGGLTQFKKSRSINDSTFIVGNDTITIRGTGAITRIGIEDTLGIQDRYMNMQGHDFVVDSSSDILLTGIAASNTSSLNLSNIAMLRSYDSVNQTDLSVYPGMVSISRNASNIPPKIFIQASDSLYTNTPDAVWVTKNDTMKIVPIDSFAAIIGSGGSGITTLASVGSSPNANSGTIASTTLTLQPADSTYPGVLTATGQKISGDKTFYGNRTNFNGYGPRLNTQLLSPAKDMDSIYVSGKYLGFGFCGVFKSGIRVIVFVKSDNHIGDNSNIMIGKSYDQGLTYDIDTLYGCSGGVNYTMGGGGIGPDNRLIIFYKKFTTPGYTPIEQRIAISDDEGSTIASDIVIGHGSNTEYISYGGLVQGANNVLLLPWYGQNGSTYSVYVIRSTDEGLTWSSPITVFSNTSSQRTESTFEHLGGGTIIGLMRSEVTDTLYGQVISYDNGITWSYQGQVSFGIKGTPAWLSAFRSQNGKMAVACYYRVGTELRALYSYADSVILGPSHWDLSKEVTIATDVQGSGYINICHPYREMEGYGYYYDETVAQTNATIKWVKVPLGSGFPLGTAGGISGLTSTRIPVATGSNSIADYSTLKYNNSSGSIVLNGATGNTWSAHNGGVIETAKAAILVSDNGYLNLLDNAYLDADYKYKSNAAAGLLAMTAGRLHFYNGPSGAAGGIISLSERFSVRAAGDYWINNSAGTAGQFLMSNGSGNATGWGNVISSQWNDVTGGVNFPTASGFVGIHNTTPRTPLDVIGVTSGSGHHTAIIEDDNPSIGMSFLLGYTSATGTNQRYKGFVMDNNGLNIVKSLNNLTGVPTSIAMFSQADNFVIGSTSDNGKRLQVNGQATVTDDAYDATTWNGNSEVPTKNAVRDKIESLSSGGITSINSQTGSNQTIASGTGISVNSSSNTHTIELNTSYITSGTYTPTLTSEVNITSDTAFPCQYMRVGNVVTVSGKIYIDYTSTGDATLGISLPISSSISNDYEVAGAMNANVNGPGVIRGDAANDRAQFYITTASSAGYYYYFTFTYQVL